MVNQYGGRLLARDSDAAQLARLQRLGQLPPELFDRIAGPKPLDTRFDHRCYRGKFVARHAAHDLTPLGQLEKIVRHAVLEFVPASPRARGIPGRYR